MSEEPTNNLPSHTFEDRVLSELAAIRGDVNRFDSRLTNLEAKVDRLEERFDSLEERVDRRLQETRPIWEAVQAQLGKLDRKFDLVIRDLYEVRQDHVVLAHRVDQLERSRTE